MRWGGRLAVTELSLAEARRLALASLGFGVKKPARAGLAHVRATVARLSAIQIDSVNVLARAHYLPTFSRYGPYPMSALDDLAHRTHPGPMAERPGHAAFARPPAVSVHDDGDVPRHHAVHADLRKDLGGVGRGHGAIPLKLP